MLMSRVAFRCERVAGGTERGASTTIALVTEDVLIRPERDADHPAIAEVVRAAFVGHPDEVASFVERIRASEGLTGPGPHKPAENAQVRGGKGLPQGNRDVAGAAQRQHSAGVGIAEAPGVTGGSVSLGWIVSERDHLAGFRGDGLRLIKPHP